MRKKLIIYFCCFTSFTSFVVLADRYSSLEIFAQVLNLIKIHYFKEVKIETLVHGAIKGLLREIDPHSQFLDSKKFKSFKNQMEGRFYGIGIEVERKEGFLIITSVFKGSSSEKQGLKQGDKIITINQKLVKDFTVGEFSEFFQNQKRSYKMTILRSGVKNPLIFKLRPSKVRVASTVFKKIKDDFYYLRIYYFSKTTFLETNKYLKNTNIKGLILDLRSNPGGSLEQTIKVADLFLDDGVIVYYNTKRNSKDQVFKSHFSDTLEEFPLVVLINEYSASASEVLAGALKDHKRALIVGRKSFGKGSIQTLFPIKDQYVLKLTVGEYKTPSKRSIHGQGIKPHVLIPKTKIEKRKFKNVLEDPEVLQAFEYLKKQK